MWTVFLGDEMDEQEEWNEAFWEYVAWEFPKTAADDEVTWIRGERQSLELLYPEDFGHFYTVD